VLVNTMPAVLKEAATVPTALTGASILVLFILAFGRVPQSSGPIKLARHS
jgi:hypothetical protein